jgi:hypothetical protein
VISCILLFAREIICPHCAAIANPPVYAQPVETAEQRAAREKREHERMVKQLAQDDLVSDLQ